VRRSTSEARAATTALLCVLVIATAACADTDPTSVATAGAPPGTLSTGTPPDDSATASEASRSETDASAGDPTSTDPGGDSGPEPGPEPGAAPAASEPSAESSGVPSTTIDGLPSVGDGESVGVDEAELFTDDPSFDVEPLRPFVVDVAGVVPIADTDDTGAEQPTGWAAFDRYLDEALIRPGNTAASVAVAIGGEIVHASAFGIRAPFISTEATGPQDRFRIASISKPITSITLLRLVEQGVVGLDDEVGQIVADHLGVTPSSGARAITVRRLLDHTSGFGKYDTQFFRGGSQDCNDAARTGMQRGTGGGGYTYSNMNFCVAGILIEALTGQSYAAAAYEQLLTPLGLSGMRLANTFDPGPDEVLHPTTSGRNYMETLGGAGSWIATPSDLVTIMNSLDLSTPGFKPLGAATLELMKAPVGGRPGQRGYGLGLIAYGPGRYGHTGTIEGTHAMTMNRGDGVTWAITVAGVYPDSTPVLESIINRAFEAAGFIAG
jgi:D-alanyl-D-alanine carboxypeptidase